MPIAPGAVKVKGTDVTLKPYFDLNLGVEYTYNDHLSFFAQLNNYLAWSPPAPILYGANLLIWGYAPPAGPALLTALTSLVGAAAGQILLQRRVGGTHTRQRRR